MVAGIKCVCIMQCVVLYSDRVYTVYALKDLFVYFGIKSPTVQVTCENCRFVLHVFVNKEITDEQDNTCWRCAIKCFNPHAYKGLVCQCRVSNSQFK